MSLIDWLREICADYRHEPVAIYRKRGGHEWPLVARDDSDLAAQLDAGGHFLPLPKEPAALANVLEVSLVAFILDKISAMDDATARQGSERGYPDVEIAGPRFGGGHHALDIKVARRARSGRQTQSRITLLTGNTYFLYPDLPWPGIIRPFGDYVSHLDLIAIYTFDDRAKSRVRDLELIVQETWRIASQQRSSTTREYIGAVQSIDDLRAGRGAFGSVEEFLTFWRKYRFRTGRAVGQQLRKLSRR
jgi:hypothetical protein